MAIRITEILNLTAHGEIITGTVYITIYIVVLPFGVIFLYLRMTFGLQCYECYNAIDSSTCSYRRECGQNEHCAIQRLQSSVDEPRYHLTCMNDYICSHGGLLNFQPIGRRKRSTRELQCCDTDLCNHELLPGSDVFTTAISSIEKSACYDHDECSLLSKHFSVCDEPETARIICPRMCGKCFDSGLRSTEQQRVYVTSTTNDCTDSELCVELSNIVDVCSHGDTAIKLCPRSCDKCDAKFVAMTTQDHCIDTNVNCFYLNKSLNLCNKTEEAVMVGCRETCNLCRIGQQTTTTTLATSTSTSTSQTTAKPTTTFDTPSTTMLKNIISSTSTIQNPATVTTALTKNVSSTTTTATTASPYTSTARVIATSVQTTPNTATAVSPKTAATIHTASTSLYATAKPTTIMRPTTTTTPTTVTTAARLTAPIASSKPVTTMSPATTTSSVPTLRVTATFTAAVTKLRSQSNPSSTAPATVGTTTPPCQQMFCLLPCGNPPRYKTDKYGCPRCECA